MRFFPKAVRGTAAALAMAVAAMAAGCAGGTPASRPASAHPVAATASMGAGTASTVPPVFAASSRRRRPAGRRSARPAVLPDRRSAALADPAAAGSYRRGAERARRLGVFRQLPDRSQIPAPVHQPGDLAGAGHRGPGPAVQAGATGYAVSPDGRAVASVISADHGDVVELVARNLVTGRRNTIIMATKPDPKANNWPPDIFSLTWAPDDVHLAVQFS